MSRMADIRQRRAALVARAAAQRDEIARSTRAWRSTLSIADRVASLYHRLRAHPLPGVLGALLLIWIGRHQTSPWAARVLTLWQLYTSIQGTRPRGHGF